MKMQGDSQWRTCGKLFSILGLPSFPGTFVAFRSSYEEDPGRGRLEFQTLVDQFYAPLYRFAMSLTRTESDAGDLVQDTFTIWAAKGHQLQDLAKVKSWLFTTLHRRFLESQRRLVRFPHVEISAADHELPAVDPGSVNQLDARLAAELLSQVDPQYRAAVALFYLEDYSYNEIAGVLEVPLGTVKSRIARGLAQLKALLVVRTPSHPPPREKIS
jgi:RNA polymerase sigma factor (sigma-70 family)